MSEFQLAKGTCEICSVRILTSEKASAKFVEHKAVLGSQLPSRYTCVCSPERSCWIKLCVWIFAPHFRRLSSVHNEKLSYFPACERILCHMRTVASTRQNYWAEMFQMSSGESHEFLVEFFTWCRSHYLTVLSNVFLPDCHKFTTPDLPF